MPDTGTRLQLKEGGVGVEESGIEWIINPYDEFALEEALRIKERKGNTEVVVLSQGPARVEKALRQALAMGADRACRIEPEQSSPYPANTARVLGYVITKEETEWDMILMGKTGVDENHFATGPMLAECLNIPHVGFVSQLHWSGLTNHDLNSPNKMETPHNPPPAQNQFDLQEPENGKWLCVRHKEGGVTEHITLSLPALFTVEKGINQPRYPNLMNIMQAKKKPIKLIAMSELNQTDLEQDRIFFESYRLPDPPPSPHVIKGSAEEQAKALVCILKEKQLIS